MMDYVGIIYLFGVVAFAIEKAYYIQYHTTGYDETGQFGDAQKQLQIVLLQ